MFHFFSRRQNIHVWQLLKTLPFTFISRPTVAPPNLRPCEINASLRLLLSRPSNC